MFMNYNCDTLPAHLIILDLKSSQKYCTR